MAIINFTFSESGIPANAHNVKQTTSQNMPMWTWETYVGLCIRDREYNGYHDSDFYMTVWNVEKGQPEEIEFASTRGWCYPSFGSYVDATPEVLEAYEKWVSAKREVARLAAIEEEKRTPKVRKEVKVVRGRKVPIGTLGRVFWIGSNHWGTSVGIETASGDRHFTSIKNVEVILDINETVEV
jgi:hypothetical protein